MSDQFTDTNSFEHTKQVQLYFKLAINNVTTMIIILINSREATFLYQRISVTIQRFNAVLPGQLVDCFRVPIVTIPDTDLHFANF